MRPRFRHRVRPPRHLLWILAIAAIVSTASLGWVAWQLLEQDTAAQAQRAQEFAERQGDRVVQALERYVADTERQVSDCAARPQDAPPVPVHGGLVVVVSRDTIRTSGSPALLFRPESPLHTTPADPRFADAAGVRTARLRLSTRDVRLATVDLAAGRIGNARSFDRGFLDDTRAPSFSPDGKTIAYQACGGECIAVRLVSTGDVRRIPSFYSVDPRWSPDGSSFVTAARDQRGRNGIFRVDASTGAASPMVIGRPFGAVPQWAPDGQSVYYRDRARIIRRHIAREHNDEIANLPGLGTFEVSPDGRWFAIKTRDDAAGTSKLLLMPADGGAAVEWLSAAKGEEFGGLRQLVWTPDSAGILVTKRTQAGFEVWHLPRQGQPRKLEVDVEGWPVQRPSRSSSAPRRRRCGASTTCCLRRGRRGARLAEAERRRRVPPRRCRYHLMSSPALARVTMRSKSCTSSGASSADANSTTVARAEARSRSRLARTIACMSA